MFKVIKLKTWLAAIFVIVVSVALSVGVVGISKNTIPKPIYTIVIDAGHGGRDDGCSGVGGTKESEVNLKIAKRLQEYMETLGIINVVMTRCDGNGLYDANVDNYKLSDMNKRIKIINDAKPDMVISIHQNSFNDTSQRGAQVFYQEGGVASREFAECVQSQLLAQLPGARLECNKGDYYLLKESNLPAVLVECGYLSNIEEELLLNTDVYQSKVAYSIMCGVIKYFGLCGND